MQSLFSTARWPCPTHTGRVPLGLAWKQPVVIGNGPGAGGTLASERAARAAADGYTLFMAHAGTLAINPWLYPKFNFDPLKSFTPVAWVARVPNILVVHPSLSANTLAELVTFAKANPGKLAYDSGGNGSAAHLTMEYLKLQTGIQVLHVPYKGTAPSVNDLLAGQVQLLFTGTGAAAAHQGGKDESAGGVESTPPRPLSRRAHGGGVKRWQARPVSRLISGMAL